MPSTDRSRTGCKLLIVVSDPSVIDAPHSGQLLYKLSRIYLKDVNSHQKVEPLLGHGNDLVRNEFIRSNFTAPPSSLPRPVPGSSPYNSRTHHNDGYRASIDLPIDPRIIGDGPSDTPSLANGMHGFDSHLLGAKNSTELQGAKSVLRRLAEQDAKITKISESMREFENELQGLKRSVKELGTSSDSHAPTTSISRDTFISNFESMLKAMKTARSETAEIVKLKAENEVMKTKLHSVAAAMGVSAADFIPMPDLSAPNTTALDGASALGKRKRVGGYAQRFSLQNKLPRGRLSQPQDDGDQELAPVTQDAVPPERARHKELEENTTNAHDAESINAPSKLASAESQSESPLTNLQGQVPTPPDSNLAAQGSLSLLAQDTNGFAVPKVASTAREDETISGDNGDHERDVVMAPESAYPDFSDEELAFEQQGDLHSSNEDDEDFDPSAEAKEKQQRIRRRATGGLPYGEEHDSLWAQPKRRRKTTGEISAPATQESLIAEALPDGIPPPPPVLRGRRRGNLKYDPVALGIANFQGDKRSKAYHEVRRRALALHNTHGAPSARGDLGDDGDESDRGSQLDGEAVVEERSVSENAILRSERQRVMRKRDQMAREAMEREELDGGN